VSEKMAKIQTVKGDISPDELGWTLSHEHFNAVNTVWHSPPPEGSFLEQFVDGEITLENRGILVKEAGVCKANLTLADIPDVIIEEVKVFKSLGGDSLAEGTLPGVPGRDALFCKKVSEVTGVNVICSSGFYIGPAHAPIVADMDVDGLKDFIVKEVKEEITYPKATGIKAGLIKAACLYPILDEEKKVVRGAARAQAETGAPFCIHPTMYDVDNRMRLFPHKLDEIIAMVQAEGANLEQFYFLHCDIFISNKRKKVDIGPLAKTLDKYPLTADIDMWGNDHCWNLYWPGGTLSGDNDRMLALCELLDQGFEKQIMLSHDTFTKMQLMKWGGYGYGYIQRHVVPWMKELGISDSTIRTMVIDNPKRMFSM
jgi:phosphotriesterase-related protein